MNLVENEYDGSLGRENLKKKQSHRSKKFLNSLSPNGKITPKYLQADSSNKRLKRV